MTTEIHGCRATMILDSINPEGIPFQTLEVRYPRMVHADAKTHRIHSGYEGETLVLMEDVSVLIDRDLSRNGRSSRAVPVKRLLEEARTNPYLPNFMANGAGMVPTLPMNEHDLKEANAVWLAMCGYVTACVEKLNALNVHKQWANRPLEFFGYIDCVLSTTNWKNFLALRQHFAAQQEMQDLANCIAAEIESSTPKLLQPGKWHLPYVMEEDLVKVWDKWRNPDGNEAQYIHEPSGYWDELKKISAARCARVSIKPFDGNASYEAEFARYDLLVTSLPVHASPTEHQATPDIFHPKYIDRDELMKGYYDHPELSGNLGAGWIQNRKLIPNEAVR